MRLTTYERQNRIMERAKELNELYKAVRSLKWELGASQADDLDRIVEMALAIKPNKSK